MKLKNYFISTMFLIAGSAFAGDWYVSSTGDDTTGNGTAGAPFASIGKAYTTMLDGDIIHVASGTYTNGVAADYITVTKSFTIMGAGAGSTIIQNGTEPISITNTAAQKRFLSFTNTSAGKTVTLLDITIRHCGWWGLTNGGGMINLNNSGTDGATLIARRCNFQYGFARQGGAIQISGAPTAGSKLNKGIFEDCSFSGNRCMIQTTNVPVYTNANNYGGAAIGSGSNGCVELRNCIFYDNGSLDDPYNQGPSFANCGNATSGRCLNLNAGGTGVYNIVTNCTFINNGAKTGVATSATLIPAVANTQPAKDFKFFNNLIVDNTPASTSIEYDFYSSAVPGTNTTAFDNFKGNVIRKAKYDAGYTLDVSNMMSDTYTGASTDVGLDGGSTPNIVQNSTGVNIVTAYGTKVVGMGIANAEVKSTDINGATRGISFSIGAVESIATKVSDVKAGLSTISVQNRIMSLKTEGVANVWIYNVSGAKVFAKTISGSETIRFDKAGLYLVKINAEVKKIQIY